MSVEASKRSRAATRSRSPPGCAGSVRAASRTPFSAPHARVLAEVDEIVDPPHRLAEQRSGGRLGGRLAAAREDLDDLEGEHRREARPLDQLLARGPVRRPDDGPALGLERGPELRADTPTLLQPRLVRIYVVERLEERLDDVDGERHGVIFREPRRQRGAKPAAPPRLLGGPDQILSLHELEQGPAGLGVFVAQAVDEADAEVERGAQSSTGPASCSSRVARREHACGHGAECERCFESRRDALALELELELLSPCR